MGTQSADGPIMKPVYQLGTPYPPFNDQNSCPLRSVGLELELNANAVAAGSAVSAFGWYSQQAEKTSARPSHLIPPPTSIPPPTTQAQLVAHSVCTRCHSIHSIHSVCTKLPADTTGGSLRGVGLQDSEQG